MNQEELNNEIALHQKWLNNEADGQRLILLIGSNLSGSNLSRSNLSRSDLSRSNLSRSDLSYANLSRSNLSRSNLSRSNLSGSNLDFSCFPLWCGSLDIKCDQHLFAQLAYHMCRLDVSGAENYEELKQYQELLKPIAQKFHRFNGFKNYEKKNNEE